VKRFRQTVKIILTSSVTCGAWDQRTLKRWVA